MKTVNPIPSDQPEEIDYLKAKLPIDEDDKNYVTTNAKDGINTDKLIVSVIELINKHDLYHLDLAKFGK